jgi:uncharacterized surface anchored protein
MISIDTLDTKDALADYAFSGVDFPAVKLDMRKKIDELKAEIVTLQSKTQSGQESQATKQATHIKNRVTGHIFEYTDAVWNHLQDRVKCDADGNEV